MQNLANKTNFAAKTPRLKGTQKLFLEHLGVFEPLRQKWPD
jgi:hypothetical protein